MARYGTWRPLASNWDAQPKMARYDLVILHTMVGSLWGTDAYFRKDGYGGVESHFGVGPDGETLQWQDTSRRAEANGAANPRAVSIETADIGEGFPKWDTKRGDAVPAWTPAQVDRLVDLVAWICDTHNIPCRLVADSRPGTRGVAWHALGVPNVKGATRSQTGGELWSTATGKVCPGPRRIAQIPGIVERAARVLELSGSPAPRPVPVPEPPPTVAPRTEEDDFMDIEIRPAADGSFRRAVKVEAGANSGTGYSSAYLALTALWGEADVIVTARGERGPLWQFNAGVTGDRAVPMRLPDGAHWVERLPDGTRTVAIEGNVGDGELAAAVYHVR